MSNLTEKRFQYIRWKFDSDGTDVCLHSKIYDKADEIIEDITRKGTEEDSKVDIVVAIGLNPSNTTIFNDDETNLYLRSKIREKFNCDGYILTNIFPKIDSKSHNVSLNDIDSKHIDELIKLLNDLKDQKIVLFFGQKGVEFLNSKNKKLAKLKETLRDIDKTKIFYTASVLEFTHPSMHKQNYTLEKFTPSILESKR